MKSKRAERVGKTLIQSQSSIWHKNTCQVGLSDWIHVSPGGNRPMGPFSNCILRGDAFGRPLFSIPYYQNFL